MTDPTSPKAEASADTAELPAITEPVATDPSVTGVTATGTTSAGPAAPGPATLGPSATGTAARTTTAEAPGKPGGPKKPWWRRLRLRGPWLTLVGALVVLVVIAALGFFWGLGPLSRLNTMRPIDPPATLSGLNRITDQQVRSQLQLDQTRDALSRINDGKKATVEAYGSLDGDRLYVIIAVRGNVNVNQVVADSGTAPDKVKKIGNATCLESTGNLPTQCYRTSNVLTVIAQSANENVNVNQVAPVAEEAFNAMK